MSTSPTYDSNLNLALNLFWKKTGNSEKIITEELTTEQEKVALFKNFEKDHTNGKRLVCSACGIVNPQFHYVQRHVANLELLKVNSSLSDHKTFSNYNDDMYHLHYIDSNGFVFLCEKCYNSIKNGNLPIFSIANGLMKKT